MTFTEDFAVTAHKILHIVKKTCPEETDEHAFLRDSCVMRLQERWSALVASVPRAITVLLPKAQPSQTGSSASVKLQGGGRQLKANPDIWKFVSHPVSFLLASLAAEQAGENVSLITDGLDANWQIYNWSMYQHYPQSKCFTKEFSLVVQKIKAWLYILSFLSLSCFFPWMNLTHTPLKGR